MRTRFGVVWHLVAVLVCGTLLAGGCAGGQPPATPREAGPASGQAVAPIRTTPKVLRMASIREPVDGVVIFAGSGDITKQYGWIFHAGLTAYDPLTGNLNPLLASKVPTVEDGDWKVLPDGGMELTWKLRPNVKWHDGTPLTAEDFVFGIQVAKDPRIPLPRTGGITSVKEVLALDAETLIVRWSEPYFSANEGTPAEMPALPRHLIGDLYRQGDPTAFSNSQFWTRDWIGLGPYRMGEWVPGSHLEALAFDDYFLGRPKIDRLDIRIILDANTVVANLLSGDIDLVTVGTLRGDDLPPIRSAWEAQNFGTVLSSQTDVVAARLSYRDPSAPWVQDKRVRHALVHGIDRQVMADTFTPGTTPPQLWLPMDDPVYKLAEQRGFPRYPYDVTQAERLMRDAGWTRGTDGMYQNAAGQKFNIEVRVVANAPVNTRRGEALADQWKQSGFGSQLYAIPTNAANRQELKAVAPGVFIMPDTMASNLFDMFLSHQIAAAENRWSAQNLLAYVNPEFDRRYQEYSNALELERRRSLHADLQRWMADEMSYLPIYYDVGSTTTAFRRGIRGPGPVIPAQMVGTWNIHLWEMD